MTFQSAGAQTCMEGSGSCVASAITDARVAAVAFDGVAAVVVSHSDDVGGDAKDVGATTAAVVDTAAPPSAISLSVAVVVAVVGATVAAVAVGSVDETASLPGTETGVVDVIGTVTSVAAGVVSAGDVVVVPAAVVVTVGAVSVAEVAVVPAAVVVTVGVDWVGAVGVVSVAVVGVSTVVGVAETVAAVSSELAEAVDDPLVVGAASSPFVAVEFVVVDERTICSARGGLPLVLVCSLPLATDCCSAGPAAASLAVVSGAAVVSASPAWPGRVVSLASGSAASTDGGTPTMSS